MKPDTVHSVTTIPSVSSPFCDRVAMTPAIGAAISLPTSGGTVRRKALTACIPSAVRPNAPATVATTMKNGNSVSSDR